jgi:hypothetical protein
MPSYKLKSEKLLQEGECHEKGRRKQRRTNAIITNNENSRSIERCTE